MARQYLHLKESEAVVVRAAAEIYSAYIATGKVSDGEEKKWIEQSVQEALQIALAADDAIQSDSETS